MPITIQVEKVTQWMPITIKTPHYYKHDISSDDGSYDSIIFGKITDDYTISVTKTVREYDQEVSYKVEREDKPNFNSHKKYLTNTEYASNKAEFDEALSEMKKFLEQEAAK